MDVADDLFIKDIVEVVAPASEAAIPKFYNIFSEDDWPHDASCVALHDVALVNLLFVFVKEAGELLDGWDIGSPQPLAVFEEVGPSEKSI